MAEDKEEGQVEIISSEDVTAMYYNAGLIMPEYKLARINSPRGRCYFTFADPINEQDPVFFASTGSVGRELPTSDFLIQDISRRGYQAAQRNYFLRMLFGSFSHSRLADLCIFGKLSLDELPDMLKKYYFDQNFYITDKEFYNLSREVQRDMISLRQWISDFEVELVFVEYPVFSYKLMLGSQIDLAAFITVTEGSGKDKKQRKVFAIIDYKSGKSGFYAAHVYQLHSNYQMFLERYPQFTEHPIYTYNLAGKNWRTTGWAEKNKDGTVNRRSTPYSFQMQSDKVDYVDYEARLKCAQNTFEKWIEKPFTYFTGEIDLRTEAKSFVVQKTIRQLVTEGDWRRFQKTSANIPESTVAL